MILKSWWAILFFLLSYFAYDQAMRGRMHIEEGLQMKLERLASDKQSALAAQKELKLQLASQEDEGFIELVLMRRLGVVPEGQQKVHFVRVP